MLKCFLSGQATIDITIHKNSGDLFLLVTAPFPGLEPEYKFYFILFYEKE